MADDDQVEQEDSGYNERFEDDAGEEDDKPAGDGEENRGLSASPAQLNISHKQLGDEKEGMPENLNVQMEKSQEEI